MQVNEALQSAASCAYVLASYPKGNPLLKAHLADRDISLGVEIMVICVAVHVASINSGICLVRVSGGMDVVISQTYLATTCLNTGMK